MRIVTGAFWRFTTARCASIVFCGMGILAACGIKSFAGAFAGRHAAIAIVVIAGCGVVRRLTDAVAKCRRIGRAAIIDRTGSIRADTGRASFAHHDLATDPIGARCVSIWVGKRRFVQANRIGCDIA